MLSMIPSPLKSHAHEAIAPLDWSVKFTVKAASPDVLSAEKSATGGSGAITVMLVMVFVLFPAALVTVKDTV